MVKAAGHTGIANATHVRINDHDGWRYVAI